jgi:hypothetical protein
VPPDLKNQARRHLERAAALEQDFRRFLGPQKNRE